MPPRSGVKRRATRKRAEKACTRCRDQKIRCSGLEPCQQCSKRDLACHFPDESQKVLVTRKYINELHERLAIYESRRSNEQESSNAQVNQMMSPDAYEDGCSFATDELDSRNRLQTVGPAFQPSPQSSITAHGAENAAEAPLTNPLAFHTIDWVPGPHGRPVFMGTSSNWAFGRRVLSMTHEAVTGTPLPPDNLFFDGNVYEFKWDGSRMPVHDDFSPSNLPTQDFAIYLINSVKFRCGRLFYLFEEDSFMKQFSIFHDSLADRSTLSRLWYVHYLVILAFGKAFVVQTSKSESPPGIDLFVQAMKIMPDFTFFECDFLEKIQVLCCTALYLHCLSCRTSAYRYISQAVSLALEGGMYTEMQGQYLDSAYVQRCGRMWWTLYVLERHMSTLLGVPKFISDENICMPYPAHPDQGQGTGIVHIQVKLAQVLGQIHQTVYGLDGQLDSRYLGATKLVLQNIADVAGQLNNLFDIDSSENVSGVSRVSAHLHLQYHQCIVLTTRPLLFIFLQSRLGQSGATPMRWSQSQSVKSLLQMCTESSRQIVKILSKLLNQGLLESFLPFDLDAAFTAAIAILMAAAIDQSLISDQVQWSQRTHAILEEMGSHGSKIAEMIASELKQLESYFSQLQDVDANPMYEQAYQLQEIGGVGPNDQFPAPPTLGVGRMGDMDFGLHFELSTEQLMQFANSLDIDSLTVAI